MPSVFSDRFADAPSTRTTGRLDSAPSTTATFSAQRPKPHTLPTGPARSPPRTTFPHPPASSTILFPSTPTRARPSASASAPPPAAAAVPLPSTTTNDPSNAGNTSLIDSPGAARHLRQARPDTASPSLPDLGLPGFDDLFPHDTSRHDSPPLARLPDRRYKGLRRDTSVRRDRESDREEMRDGVEDDEDHGTLDGTEPGGSTIVVKRGKQPTKKRDVNPRRHNVRNGSECRSMDNANDQPGETFGSRGRDRSNSEGHRSDTHRSTDEEQDPDEESEKEETRRPDPKRRRKAEPAIGMKRKDREESDTGTEQRKRQDQKQMNAKLAVSRVDRWCARHPGLMLCYDPPSSSQRRSSATRMRTSSPVNIAVRHAARPSAAISPTYALSSSESMARNARPVRSMATNASSARRSTMHLPRVRSPAGLPPANQLLGLGPVNAPNLKPRDALDLESASKTSSKRSLTLLPRSRRSNAG